MIDIHRFQLYISTGLAWSYLYRDRRGLVFSTGWFQVHSMFAADTLRCLPNGQRTSKLPRGDELSADSKLPQGRLGEMAESRPATAVGFASKAYVFPHRPRELPRGLGAKGRFGVLENGGKKSPVSSGFVVFQGRPTLVEPHETETLVRQ